MKKNRGAIFGSIFVVLAASLFLLTMSVDTQAQYNYDHVNVTTRVNVTNAVPEIVNISVDGELDNLTLTAGGTHSVYCNATIRDWNGFNDLQNVNATLYYYLNSSLQIDDRNEHYTNSSCTAASNDGLYTANYTCGFDVYYFANNGTWYCNVSVIDSFNFTDSDTANTSIDSLYALNVTNLIDYGNLSVTETSENITATVTNFGNSAINISVLGYGLVEGDGLGFVCGTGTNISIEHQRFSSLVSADYASKTNLAAISQDVNTTLLQQTSDLTPVTQETYWQLYVPPNPFGVCTGTVRFTATQP